MPQLLIYPLPSFLQDVMTARQYNRWLHKKAQMLFQRDRKRGRAYAVSGKEALYRSLIHLAVVNSEGRDPYTGEKLAWELVSTWTDKKTPSPQEKRFALLPTIDHRDPDQLDFQIVSWRINLCKNYLTPSEFIALCRLVARRAK